VNATAAAATTSTAIIAASTVAHVASLVTIRSRLTLKAGCRAGMVGIAGRESIDIGWFSSTHLRTNDYSAAAARKAAMSMIKPVANQINSLGMIEIMWSRMGRFKSMEFMRPSLQNRLMVPAASCLRLRRTWQKRQVPIGV
jgi:hypothetical protein